MKERKFTDERLNDLYVRSISGDKEAQKILKREYSSFLRRTGVYMTYGLLDAQIQLKKKLKKEPTKNQLKVVSGALGLYGYKRIKYKTKIVIFETDIDGKIRKKISEIKIG